MSFGICSAPEVFQHGMHEIIEGSHGTEVLQDTSLLLGLEISLMKPRVIMTRIWMHSYCNVRTEED